MRNLFARLFPHTTYSAYCTSGQCFTQTLVRGTASRTLATLEAQVHSQQTKHKAHVTREKQYVIMTVGQR